MAKETVSRGKSAMGGGSKSKKSSGSKAHSIHIHRAKSGGFVVHHHPKPGSSDEVEQHVLPDLQALQAHLGDQMGDQGPAPAPTPDPTQQAAGPQAGPPAGAPPGM